MPTEVIPLSRLATTLGATLGECADTGRPVVVELPDRQLVAIHSLDPTADDDLTDELLATNAAFRAVVAKSAASPRKPFAPARTADAASESAP